MGENNNRRLFTRLADVAERLPALRSRGNQGGIGTTALPRLRSRGARLLGRRFTTKTQRAQRIKNKRKEHSIHWLASAFLILLSSSLCALCVFVVNSLLRTASS